MRHFNATRTAACVLTGIGAIALAADPPAKIAPQPTYQTDMDMLAEAGTPGMHHRFLNHFIGDWDVLATLRRPGSPPEEYSASATFDWALDGRFLQEEISAEVMGMQLSMLNYLGYNNFKGRYTIAWLSSTSTSITTAIGYQNHDGTEITLFGTIDEPHLNLHERTVKTIYRSESKDRFVVEIHDLHIPEPSSIVMTMVYTRL